MNLGRVIKIISETEIKVYCIELKKDIVVKASNEYVSSLKVELEDTENPVGNIVVEYDLDKKIVNENIEM